MAAVAVVMIIAAAAYQAHAQRKAGKEQQKMKELQAKQQEHMASVVRAKAGIKERDVREHTRRLLATQRAQMATAGVQIHEGSPLDLFVETRVHGERDAQRVRWLAKQSSDVHIFNAKLLQYEGKTLKAQADRQAMGTLLSGAASAASAGATLGGSGAGGSGTAPKTMVV